MGGEIDAIDHGSQADLVLLDGNPLRDIQSTERIAGVMHWLDRADLARRRAEIRVWVDRRCSATTGQTPCFGSLEVMVRKP